MSGLNLVYLKDLTQWASREEDNKCQLLSIISSVVGVRFHLWVHPILFVDIMISGEKMGTIRTIRSGEWEQERE